MENNQYNMGSEYSSNGNSVDINELRKFAIKYNTIDRIVKEEETKNLANKVNVNELRRIAIQDSNYKWAGF